MAYVLGVDLGTTYSAAATATGGKADRFPLGNRTPTIPSIVCLRSDGEVLVGEAAERRSLTEPGRTAREFKRRLGDPTPMILGGTPYGAETLSSHLLRWIVAKVTEQHGAAPDAIVLSHPANWGPFKLELLQQTVQLADVGPVSFISEPEAAAVHYGQQEKLEPGQSVGVYDFGGGTFDAAVLRATTDGFELLGQPEGLERIGGIDFDQAVFAHVNQSIGGAISELDPNDTSAMAALQRLRDECQLAKEQLSQDTDVDIPVLLPGLQTEVRLTRAEFESMIRPRIAETISSLERAVRSAGLTFADVTKILLVGGTSRIPLVGQMVREATGLPIAVDAHPKFAIAIGAALTGAAGVSRPSPVIAPVVATPPPAPSAPAEPPAEPPVADVPAATPAAATPANTLTEQIEPTPATPATPAAAAAPSPVGALPSRSGGAGDGGGVDGGAGDGPEGDGGAGRPKWMTAAAAVLAVIVVVGIASSLGNRKADTLADPGDDPSSSPSATAIDYPSATPDPTPTLPAHLDWVTEPAADKRFVEITDLSMDGGNFVATFDTYNFDPNERAIRFFFDGLPDDDVTPAPVEYQDWTSGQAFGSYSVFDRPITAKKLCAFVVGESGTIDINPDTGSPWETGHCATIDWTQLEGEFLPGDRFIEFTDLETRKDRYVPTFEAHNFTPAIAGSWHVHAFWYPTYNEDNVGVNRSGGDWKVWDLPYTIDDPYFAVSSRPGDATHICAVVAQSDHTILLDSYDEGYASGDCWPLAGDDPYS